jgi:hypothetical protein
MNEIKVNLISSNDYFILIVFLLFIKAISTYSNVFRITGVIQMWLTDIGLQVLNSTVECMFHL